METFFATRGINVADSFGISVTSTPFLNTFGLSQQREGAIRCEFAYAVIHRATSCPVG